MENSHYIRPATPQPLLHRAGNKLDAADKPSKFIVLLLAPTSVAGKVQIATSVSSALSCPLFQGDSLHESSAKAASVGASRSDDGGKGRYQRMWLSKLTRTGLLFPEESRPATEGFSGFGGGSSSSSTSRRGSNASTSSTASFGDDAAASGTNQYVNRSVFTAPRDKRHRGSNSILMVLTHPKLESWHKKAIKEATKEYGIGIIFVPLFKDDADEDDEEEHMILDELPVLRPLDPSTLSQFTSFDALRAASEHSGGGNSSSYGDRADNRKDNMTLEVDTDGSIANIIEEVVRGVENKIFSCME